MKVAVSGRPGSGKTTLALKVVDIAKRAGVRVGGFITLEVREGGARVGFDVMTIPDGQKAPLARVGVGAPRVGKYVVNLGACSLMLSALKVADVDLLVVDEIGPMESKCPDFLDEVRSALLRASKALAVFHLSLVETARQWGFKVVMISQESRDQALREVLSALGFRNV
ncbi:MAG: nucleoside-triphosphatase [Thermoproteus sp.]